MSQLYWHFQLHSLCICDTPFSTLAPIPGAIISTQLPNLTQLSPWARSPLEHRRSVSCAVSLTCQIFEHFVKKITKSTITDILSFLVPFSIDISLPN